MTLRQYGPTGTIHSTKHLDVEVDANGRVVAVWFRCQLLPFRQTDSDEGRANEMRQAYEAGPVPELHGVTLRDPEGRST